MNTPYMTEFATCWGLVGGSLLIASPVIFFTIKEHSSLEADLQFSDVTAGEVGGIQMQEQDKEDLVSRDNEGQRKPDRTE